MVVTLRSSRSNLTDGKEEGQGNREGKASVEYVQPITRNFEFLGPHGPIFTILSLPLVVVALFVLTEASHGDPVGALPRSWAAIAPILEERSFFSGAALSCYCGWVSWHWALAALLPGQVVMGSPLPTPARERLSYTLNGMASLVLTAAMAFLYISTLDKEWAMPFLWIADNYLQLAISGIIFSIILSTLLYLASFRSDQVILAKGGNSGYPFYDLWMGRELNPRIFSNLIDLKFVCELRPGLIGWLLLNISLAIKQYVSLGGALTNSMIFVIFVQGYYVLDALLNEGAILTTMDIATDGFGFMLVFGDLVWVPFTYSLQARYLSLYPQNLSPEFLGIICGLNLLGLYIFRSSNSEKNAFRTNPNDPALAHLTYIKTESGSKLLTSGWWGRARKINYTGDWLMSVAWCLPCSFASPLPYFYSIYFAILLIHRAGRDDEICHEKYGRDWEKYNGIVKYKFFPGIW